MKRTVKELFQFHSGSGALTERAIYDNQPASAEDVAAVYSSATDDSTNMPHCSRALIISTGSSLFSEEIPVILVARNGQAGTMRLIQWQQFAITDHAYAMTLKRDAADLVDPLFFTIAYQDAFFDLVTSKDGNGTFAKGVAESLTIWLPPIEMQRDIAKAWRKKEGVKDKLAALLERVQALLKKPARTEHEREFFVKELFRVTSGVRITQKEVYENPGDCPVVTSQTTNNGIAWHAGKRWLAGFKKNGKPVLVDTPCVTWTKDGNAGKLFLRDAGFYPNDHAGVLTPTANVALDWFALAQQGVVDDHATAKGNQGMLYEGQMANILIQVPVDAETNQPDLCEQQRIAAQYYRLQSLETKLQTLVAGCDTALERIRQLALSLADENGLAKAVPGTVLFLDVKGSTAMYEKSGDQAAFAVINRVSKLLQGIVTAHDGRVIKTIGDGIMCEFSRPEDAVTAALAMQSAIKPYELHGKPVAIRIGIHYGPVLAKDGDVFGDAVNVAARLEGVCEIGGVSVSDEAFNLLPAGLQTQSVRRGSVQLKGKRQPVLVWDFVETPSMAGAVPQSRIGLAA